MAWRECVNHYFLWTRMHWLTDWLPTTTTTHHLVSILVAQLVHSLCDKSDRRKKKRKTGKCSLHLFFHVNCAASEGTKWPLSFELRNHSVFIWKSYFLIGHFPFPFSREYQVELDNDDVHGGRCNGGSSVRLVGVFCSRLSLWTRVHVFFFFSAIAGYCSGSYLVRGQVDTVNKNKQKANHNSQSLRTLASAQQARILIGFFFFFFLPVCFLSCSDCCVCTQHLNICHLSTTNLLRTLSEIRAHVSVHRRM